MDTYQVGISILMSGNAASAVAMLARQFAGLHTHVHGVQQSINRLGAVRIGALIGIAAAIEGMKSLIHYTKDLSHELVQIEKMGINPAQFGEVRRSAIAVTRSVKGVTEKEALEGYGAAYSLFGHESALKMMEPLAKFGQVAGNTSGKFETSIGDVMKMLRAADIMGQFTNAQTHEVDIDRLMHYLDVSSKIMLATHGLVTPQTMLGMAQQGGISLRNLSDEGLITMGMMSQAMGGPRAGTAMMSLFQQMVGGTMKKATAEEMTRLGLLSPEEWKSTKGGGVQFVGDSAQKRLGGQLGRDPLGFLVDVIKPAMEKHGITDPEHQLYELFKLLGRQTTQRFTGEMLSNYKQMTAERFRIEGIPGIDVAGNLANTKDVEQALHNVDAAWHNLWYAVAGDGEKIAHGLDAVATGISKLTDSVRGLDALKDMSAFDIGREIGKFIAKIPGYELEMIFALQDGLTNAVQAFVSAIPGVFAGIGSALIESLRNALGFSGGGAPAPGSHTTPPMETTPGGAGMVGPHTGKRSYNAIPPPAGASSGRQFASVYMDGQKVGDLVTRRIADRGTRPLEGSAHFDPTWLAPASDVSYA